MQTLKTANFWLIFISLLLGSGSGLTVIDNLGQISESLGYKETHIFVSMISIWNFLGRVGGGYFSEIVVRKCKQYTKTSYYQGGTTWKTKATVNDCRSILLQKFGHYHHLHTTRGAPSSTT